MAIFGDGYMRNLSKGPKVTFSIFHVPWSNQKWSSTWHWIRLVIADSDWFRVMNLALTLAGTFLLSVSCIIHRQYGEKTLTVEAVGILYTNVSPAGIFIKLLPRCTVIHSHRYPVVIGILPSGKVSTMIFECNFWVKGRKWVLTEGRK